MVVTTPQRHFFDQELYDGARPVPLTDGGTPIAKLFPKA